MSKPNDQLRTALLESLKNELTRKLIDQALNGGMSLQAVINEILGQGTINGIAMPINSLTKTQRQELKQTMNKITQTEEKRIAELEQIRNCENTMLIDEAIRNGQTAGQVAHFILQSQAEAMRNVDIIAAAINEQPGRQPMYQKQDDRKTTSNESLEDIIAASINKHPGRQKLDQNQEPSITSNQSLEDIIADSANNNR